MPETIPPRTELERELVRIWERVLECAPIGVQEDFFDLGGTSVKAARIFAAIEEVFHKRLPVSVILGAPTIELLAASLVPGKSPKLKAYVFPIQSEGKKPALFCVRDGTIWRAVAKHLGPNQPVFSLELEPGAIEGMKGPKPMEKLARHMVSALSEKQARGPYYLCGYCQNGLFACEVARQLKMYGQEVGLLALVETRNPFPDFRARLVNGARRNAIRLAFQVDQLQRLMRAGEVSRYLRDRRLQLKGLLVRMTLKVSPHFQLRARQAGWSNAEEFLYIVGFFPKTKPPACPTAIFRCKDWPIRSAGDPYFGWRGLFTGRTETHELPGDHEGIFREPNVQVLAEKLRACLQNTGQAETPDNDMIIDDDRTLYSG
jgi:thioesterase domain-containing protein